MSTIQPITIAGRKIGPGEPPWIVAEMSANHNRSFDRAIKIIDAAAEAGADAIKVQAFSPDEMTMDKTTIVETWNRTLVSICREAALPWEWLPKLKERAEAKGLVFFASVFSPAGVERLEREIDPPCYKIASFELIDVPLLRAVGATGKPVILSTGMATHGEIQDAIEWIDAARSDQGENSIGWRGIALLHCVSAYPAPVDKMGLRAIPAMMERFGVPVGLSDHSKPPHEDSEWQWMDTVAPVAAVAVGACIIEKHLMLADDDSGLDKGFSMQPVEFGGMVEETRAAYQAIWGLGNGGKQGPGCAEKASRKLRRSLYVTKDMKAGEAFTADNVRCLRPAKGIDPKHYDEVMGRFAGRNIVAGTPFAWDLWEGGTARAKAERAEKGATESVPEAVGRGFEHTPTSGEDAVVLRRLAAGVFPEYKVPVQTLAGIATRMEAREEAHIAAMIEVEEDANYDMRDRAALDEIQREATDG